MKIDSCTLTGANCPLSSYLVQGSSLFLESLELLAIVCIPIFDIYFCNTKTALISNDSCFRLFRYLCICYPVELREQVKMLTRSFVQSYIDFHLGKNKCLERCSIYFEKTSIFSSPNYCERGKNRKNCRLCLKS